MAAVEVDKFTEHLRNNADDKGFGHGRCAYFVRRALAVGGYTPATWPGQEYRKETSAYVIYRP